MSYVYDNEHLNEWPVPVSNVNVNSALPDWTAIASIVNSVHVDDWTAIASIVNSVCVDYWTAEWVIIASNVNSVPVDDWTTEWVVIASKGAKRREFVIAPSFVLC